MTLMRQTVTDMRANTPLAQGGNPGDPDGSDHGDGDHRPDNNGQGNNTGN